MKPQTEELLYFLLWTADTITQPTWRNLNDSFETWAWRNGLGRRLAELSRQQLIERHPEPKLARVVRLTELGRQLALGGRDPQQRWQRPWDGTWRLVLFDIPIDRNKVRQQLRRLLRRQHFGCLQKSVWVTPDPADEVRRLVGTIKVEARAFLIVEGRPAAGESDAEIVAGAWNFRQINRRYERHVEILQRPPRERSRFMAWAREEQAAWKAVVRIDPLLPRQLLPANYGGFDAFHLRQTVAEKLASRFIKTK